MKGLLETWMETGSVGEDNKEEEAQPTQNTTQPTPAPAAVGNSTNTDVKDAFEDLFNN
jgi:hypothetical protein